MLPSSDAYGQMLSDFVNGHLPAVQALCVLAQVERDPELSRQLEELIELQEYLFGDGRDLCGSEGDM